MQYPVITWRAAILNSSLHSTTKLVLFALSTYMNEHGFGCYPSQDTIAEKTSLSRRAVIKHIEIAISSGYLLKEKRNIKGRKWDANEYLPSVPDQLKKPSGPSHGVNDMHPLEDRGVNHVHLRGEPRSQQGVNHVHTNCPIELSNEIDPLPPKGDGHVQNGHGQELSLFTGQMETNQSADKRFEEFYSVYPRKEKKKRAEISFKRALSRAPFDLILRGAKRYAESRTGKDPKFTALATTWLNGDDWSDWAEKPEESAWDRERRRMEELFPGSTVHV